MPFDNTTLDETTRILIDARGFIERGWCKDQQALDYKGWSVHPRCSDAVAWCAYGALVAAGVPDFDVRHPSVLRLMAEMGNDIAGTNNRQADRAPILAAFDAAITRELSI